jgi:hypothetical protein
MIISFITYIIEEAFMTLRGLILGIAVCFPAMVFASSSWGQSQPNRSSPSSTDVWTSAPIIAPEGAMEVDSIKKALDAIESVAQRSAMKEIVAVLDQKSYRQLLDLQLAPDACQDIACQDVPPDVVRRYVAAYATMRAADDARQTALRNAAAGEWSVVIAAAAACISLLSLLVSGLSYRRAGRSTKSAIPA